MGKSSGRDISVMRMGILVRQPRPQDTMCISPAEQSRACQSTAWCNIAGFASAGPEARLTTRVRRCMGEGEQSTHQRVPSTSKTTPRSLGRSLLDSVAPPSANGANRLDPPCAAIMLANLRIRGASEEDRRPARGRNTRSLRPMATVSSVFKLQRQRGSQDINVERGRQTECEAGRERMSWDPDTQFESNMGKMYYHLQVPNGMQAS